MRKPPAALRNVPGWSWTAWGGLSLTAALLAGPILAESDRRAAILAPTADFSQAERWEELSGGTATNQVRFDRKAFSQFSTGLALEQQGRFFIGDGLFRRAWVTAPASTRAADGLGPLYNARACQRCHLQDGRGHPPAKGENSISMAIRLSTRLDESQSTAVPDPVYGAQLQNLAIPGHRPEGQVEILYKAEAVAMNGETASLRRPEYRIRDLGYGPMHPGIAISPRVAPPMIGLGLLEAVAEEEILAREDPDDRDGDGISGRANRVLDLVRGQKTLGRFGWKAVQPTLRQQAAVAFSADIGMSSLLQPDEWGDCTERQKACRSAVHGESEADGGYEISAEMMDLLEVYIRNLAVPARRGAGEPEVLRGKKLFYDMGCIGCHTPKLATRKEHPVSALAGQLIWPYTDMLLHDMGDGLADRHSEGEAAGREWRTPPLWGIGLTQEVSGHTYFLHDGRARNLTEAILWHGGESQAARDAFAELEPESRAAVLTFLNSL